VLLALSGARDSLCSHAGLERLVRQHVHVARLEDAPIPVHLVATDLLCGEEVLLSAGDPLSAVLASSAVPAVLPPVRRHGRCFPASALPWHPASLWPWWARPEAARR